MLITSAEHYSSNAQRDFNYKKYLDELQSGTDFNLTRTFTGVYTEDAKAFGTTRQPIPWRYDGGQAPTPPSIRTEAIRCGASAAGPQDSCRKTPESRGTFFLVNPLSRDHTIADHHIAVLVGVGLAELEVGDLVAGVDDEQVGAGAAGELIAV